MLRKLRSLKKGLKSGKTTLTAGLINFLRLTKNPMLVAEVSYLIFFIYITFMLKSLGYKQGLKNEW